MGNLATPQSVQKLQMALHAKAKAEATYRFYGMGVFAPCAGARRRARAKASNSAGFGAMIAAEGWHSGRKNGHFDHFRGRSACLPANRSPASLETAVFTDFCLPAVVER